MTTAPLTAQELDDAVPGASAATRPKRRDLTLVASRTTRKAAPMVIVSVLMFVAAVFAVLMVNIQVSQQQYSLVGLRQEQTELTAANADLTEKLDNAQAPQALSAKAKKMGMVYSSSYATVDVSQGTFGAQGIPSVTTENFVLPVPAPLAPKTRAAVDPTVTAQSVKASEQKLNQAELNGGTIPAPAQKSQPSSKDASTAPAQKSSSSEKKH